MGLSKPFIMSDEYHSLRALTLSFNDSSSFFSNKIPGFSFEKTFIISLNILMEILYYFAIFVSPELRTTGTTLCLRPRKFLQLLECFIILNFTGVLYPHPSQLNNFCGFFECLWT